MELQTLTFIVVGITFAIYIGIAFWHVLDPPVNSISLVVASILSLTAWRQRLTGCPLRLSSPWQV